MLCSYLLYLGIILLENGMKGIGAMLYLGTNIKEYRLKKGYTQEQLAYELGVSSQTVSRWETGGSLN
jgi:DNA-binding XRE family transcriptional regulator